METETITKPVERIAPAKHNRFKDAPWYITKENAALKHLIIGGAGGIGSWLAILLTRAGFSPIVYDFDMIEEHNLGGQLYSNNYIGKHKVTALSEIIKQFTGETIRVSLEKVTEFTMTGPFVFSAFDNMEARKVMFKKWADTYCSKKSKDYNPDAIFIDGRLNAEQLWIYCVRASEVGQARKYWEENIFPDSDIEDAPCSMKQTSHTAAMIASFMTGFFTNHIANILDKDSQREIPFSFEYFIPINLIG